MKAKPDDRSDNAQRIQDNIDNTMRNISLANEVIATSNSPEEVQNMKERNERRRESLKKMCNEIDDEVMKSKNSMK